MVAAMALSRRERVIFGVVLLANLIPIWALRYFPGQDTGNHLYVVEVLRSLLDGSAEPELTRTFAPALSVKSNLLFHLVMLGLCKLGLSVELAHRLVLSAYAVAFPLAGLFCVRASGGDPVLALPFLPLVWSWFAVQGLYNYVLSLPPALVWLGLLARDWRRPRRTAVAALGLVAVLVYAAHSGTFVAMLFVTAVRVLTDENLDDDLFDRPVRLRVLSARGLTFALAPALGLAAFGLVPAAWGSGAQGPPEVTLAGWETYGVVEAAGSFFVELAMRYHVPDLLWLGPPVLALIAIPLAAWREPTAGVRRWPLVAAGGLVVLYFALPHIVWGSDACPRLRPLVLFCLAAYAGVRLSARARQRLATMALICGLGSAGALLRDGVRIGRELDDFASGAAYVRSGSRVYPLVFDPRGDSLLIRPYLHAWGYYGLERHVATPFAFAWHPSRFPLRYRELPLHAVASPFPSDAEDEPYALVQGRLCRAVDRFAASVSCAQVRQEAEARWATLGRAYDYLLTWAAPGDFTALLRARGYRLVHAQGRLALYQPPAGAPS